MSNTTTTKRYWYLTVVFSCPVCFSEKKWRERVYEKPKGWEWHDSYDYCNERGG